MRKTIIAIAAALALGAATTVTGAMAAPHGGGGHGGGGGHFGGGHFGGGHFGGGHFGGGHFGGGARFGGGAHFGGHFGGGHFGHFAGRGFGYGAIFPGIGLYAYEPYYGGCYTRRHWVLTPHGWVLRRIWICD